MEVNTDVAAELLGVHARTILRYGDQGKIEYRAHGLRNRRRYELEHLRTVAPALNLRFNEQLAQTMQQAHQ